MIHYTISAENGPLTEWELEDSAIRGVTKLVTASLDRTALVHRRIGTSKRISFLINVQFYLAMLALIRLEDQFRGLISRLVPGQIDHSPRPRSSSETCSRARHICYWPRNLEAPCESPSRQLHCPSCVHGMRPSMVSGRILTPEMVVFVHQRAASRIGRQVAHRRRLLRAAKLIEVASRRCSPLGRWISTKLSLKEGRRLRAQSGLQVGLTGDLAKPRFP
jgi:hypothetical protein